MKSFKQYLLEQQKQYDNTIIKLVDLYKNSFRSNNKTIIHLNNNLINTENIEEKHLINEKIKQEYNKLWNIINIAEKEKHTSLNEKLINVVSLIANNGVSLKENIAPNASFRFKNILKKIGRENLIHFKLKI